MVPPPSALGDPYLAINLTSSSFFSFVSFCFFFLGTFQESSFISFADRYWLGKIYGIRFIKKINMYGINITLLACVHCHHARTSSLNLSDNAKT